jgi:hypothetical protein
MMRQSQPQSVFAAMLRGVVSNRSKQNLENKNPGAALPKSRAALFHPRRRARAVAGVTYARKKDVEHEPRKRNPNKE